MKISLIILIQTLKCICILRINTVNLLSVDLDHVMDYSWIAFLWKCKKSRIVPNSFKVKSLVIKGIEIAKCSSFKLISAAIAMGCGLLHSFHRFLDFHLQNLFNMLDYIEY